MANYKKKTNFLESPEAPAFRQALIDMVNSDRYNTSPSYIRNTLEHPDSLIDFVDKHMQYMCDHPSTDAKHYLANLKLMTRKIQV
jgi:hypothetical protein